MEVYTDFFMYSSGVYSPTNLARATVAGYHAVRILGWGQVDQVFLPGKKDGKKNILEH